MKRAGIVIGFISLIVIVLVSLWGHVDWSSKPTQEKLLSRVSAGQEGRLTHGGMWSENVVRVPVGKTPGDYLETLRAIQAKDLLTLSQMMDGGRFKNYPVGSKIRVLSTRPSLCEVRFADGFEGWISDTMFE